MDSEALQLLEDLRRRVDAMETMVASFGQELRRRLAEHRDATDILAEKRRQDLRILADEFRAISESVLSKYRQPPGPPLHTN